MLNHTGVLFPVMSLNDQFHPVGVFVEVSVKVTANGAAPLVTLEVNLATGGMMALTASILISVSSPAELVTFSCTGYNPFV